LKNNENVLIPQLEKSMQGLPTLVLAKPPILHTLDLPCLPNQFEVLESTSKLKSWFRCALI